MPSPSTRSARPSAPPDCPLCQEDGGLVIWRGTRDGDSLRVIRALEPGWPAFYRVVWEGHVREWSDLSAAQRQWCMDVLVAVEQAIRNHLQPAPTKINLAALGNMVAHLHWHVIARYDWDSHFPAAVWATAQRPRDAEREAQVSASLDETERQMRVALDALARASS